MMGLIGGRSRSSLPQAVATAAPPPQASGRRGLFGGFDPNVSGRDRWMALSATLADLGQGGTQNLQQLRAEDRQQQIDSLNALKAKADMAQAERQRTQPQFFNTRAGVVGVAPDGASEVVYALPEDTTDGMGGIPTGMIRNEDGSLSWAPGYVESQLELGRGRRRTVIDNPVPSRARASGGGGSRSSSPSRPAQSAAPRSNPWDRDY